MIRFFVVFFIVCFSCAKKDCPSPIANEKSTLLSYTNTIVSSSSGVVIQNPSLIKDAYLAEYYPDNNYGINSKIFCSAWTYSGTPAIVLFLLKFDYSLLPVGVDVKSAKITLYADTSNIYIGSPNPDKGHYGSNLNWSIKRVVKDWDELNVTYNTKPICTEYNKIEVSSPELNTTSSKDIDVTELVKDQLNTKNYGFEISLNNNSPYKRLAFYASDSPHLTLIPKLVIEYQ